MFSYECRRRQVKSFDIKYDSNEFISAKENQERVKSVSVTVNAFWELLLNWLLLFDLVVRRGLVYAVSSHLGAAAQHESLWWCGWRQTTESTAFVRLCWNCSIFVCFFCFSIVTVRQLCHMTYVLSDFELNDVWILDSRERGKWLIEFTLTIEVGRTKISASMIVISFRLQMHIRLV